MVVLKTDRYSCCIQAHTLGTTGLVDKVQESLALCGHVSLCFHQAVFLFGTAIELLKIVGRTTWIDKMANLLRNDAEPHTAPVNITDGPSTNILDITFVSSTSLLCLIMQ